MDTSYPGLSISNRDFTIVLSHKPASKIILSVPHDCLPICDFPSLFQRRRNGAVARDLFVWPIAMAIMERCIHRGLRIDSVRSLMSRVYLDMNRSVSVAENLDPDASDERSLEDTLLIPLYRQYHDTLGRLLRRSIKKFDRDEILLIDLHGFSWQPSFAPARGYDLILGTANRTTVHFGSPDSDFAKFMGLREYRVFLPEESTVVPGVSDPFDAGQISRYYARQYGINAIQIEISSTFRRADISKDARERGQKLANDIAEFLLVHFL